MEQNFLYKKLNLDVYEDRRNKLLKNEKLREIGFKITPLRKTTFGYDIELFSIGKGDKELFIVGGTHSSEIISVDFVTQLIEKIPYLKEFDPNLFKINIISIQNPEGFDINTSLLRNISDSEFLKKSHEYYLRYRTDVLIYNAFKSLSEISDKPNFPIEFKKLLENENWKNLSNEKAMPEISIFNQKVKEINLENTLNYKFEIIKACNETMDKLDTSNLHSLFLYEFLLKLKEYFISALDLNNYSKLHQQMFENTDIDALNIKNLKLKEIIKDIYKSQPNGSIINHDSTGLGINLNSNQPQNPGIDIIKNRIIKYMPGAKSNLRNYQIGPVGLPCLDINKFEYALENQVLFSILNESYESNKYLATLLYHGTGGMIYYKPCEDAMSEEDYNYFLKYNEKLANAYNEGITNFENKQYRKMPDATNTGYGDELRKTFPGVLLIELSRMGGNPIGPYGDEKNIYNTFNENFYGIDSILGYFKKSLTNANQKIK